MAVTDVDTSFPDVELAPGSTITVDTGNSSAKVTLLNVYGISPVTGQEIELAVLPLSQTYGPDATGTEAPGRTP